MKEIHSLLLCFHPLFLFCFTVQILYQLKLDMFIISIAFLIWHGTKSIQIKYLSLCFVRVLSRPFTSVYDLNNKRKHCGWGFLRLTIKMVPRTWGIHKDILLAGLFAKNESEKRPIVYAGLMSIFYLYCKPSGMFLYTRKFFLYYIFFL